MSLRLIKHHEKNTHGRVKVKLHAFLTSVQDGGECSASRPCCFQVSQVHILLSGCEGPRGRYGHYGEEKNHLPLRGIEPQFLTVQPVVYVGMLINLWLSKVILFLQDNAAPHKAAITHQKLSDLHFEALKHPA
jgi:hypothetical protein